MAQKANSQQVSIPTVNRQNDTTNINLNGARIETGWGKMAGNGSVAMSETVTFSTPFTQVPIVIVSGVGGVLDTTSNYPDLGNFYVDNLMVNSSTQTTSSFKLAVARAGGGTFGTGTSVYYTWIAIGV